MTRLLAMTISALLVCSCAEQERTPQPETSVAPATESVAKAAARPTPACCEEIKDSGELPDMSVYQLESVWRSQEEKRIALSRFRGRPIVIAMIFTWCEYACPRTLADLKAIEAKLTVADRKRVRFILVSFDSEKDKPAVLKRYALENELDLSRWTLLNGSEADVRELAAVLGIQYKRSKTVGFSHSNLITVLDTEGRVAHRQNGIGASSKTTLDVIAKL